MTISITRVIAILFGAAATTWGAGAAFAQDTEQCAGLPSQGALKNALTLARNQANGGFNLDMWATVVNRDGLVCAVAFTGSDRGQQWPGSRVISAQKAIPLMHSACRASHYPRPTCTRQSSPAAA